MSSELYSKPIMELAHSYKRELLKNPTAQATAFSPLCGDKVSVKIQVWDGRITRIGFEAKGCILCKAATIAMAQHAKKLCISEIPELIALLERTINTARTPQGKWHKLHIFAVAHNYKSRHDCILLPFRALQDAISPKAS